MTSRTTTSTPIGSTGTTTLNRLTSASVSSGPYRGAASWTYVHDRFGNRWQQNVTSGSGPSSSLSFDANNHIIGSGVTYDAAGNVTDDDTNTYTYNPEERIATVRPQTSTSVTVNGDGAWFPQPPPTFKLQPYIPPFPTGFYWRQPLTPAEKLAALPGCIGNSAVKPLGNSRPEASSDVPDSGQAASQTTVQTHDGTTLNPVASRSPMPDVFGLLNDTGGCMVSTANQK